MIYSRYAVIFSALGLLGLAACTPPSDVAYLNRGSPESLLDVSSEVVSLTVASKRDVADLSDWVNKDAPTRAEINCLEDNKVCRDALRVFDKRGIPVMLTGKGEPSVTLVYERVLARDCDQRYVNNTKNFYNTPHPSFGCSVAANMVQHVTNKQEFINPSVSSDPSAVRAVNDYKRAYTPRAVVEPYTISEPVTTER